jgi:hypothetical protein
MRLLETLSLAAVLTAAVATPLEPEEIINHVEKLSALHYDPGDHVD